MNEEEKETRTRMSFEEAIERCLERYDGVFRELARIEAEERRAELAAKDAEPSA